MSEAPPSASEYDYGEYLEPAKRLMSKDWLDSLRVMPRSRILQRIRQPLLCITAWAFLVSALHCLVGMPGLPTLSAHTLLGSGLSLLLVFRTNSAYQRFTEGRKIWNDILDISRDIVLSTSLFKKHAGATRVKIVRMSVQAFPLAMQEHVRAKEFDNMLLQPRLERMLRELEDKGSGPDHGVEASVPSANRPLRIVGRLLRTLQSIPSKGDYFTNRERVWLLTMVNSLSHTVGRCERLVQTPVPLSYARHTSRFVSIWTLTLPLALVHDFRWLTAPIILLITWALFGILEIGHTIEDPFRASLELTPICQAIYHDAERALRDPRAAAEPESPGQAPGWPAPRSASASAASGSKRRRSLEEEIRAKMKKAHQELSESSGR